MPKYIIKIHDDKFNKDYYMDWSTVVDAPVTYGQSLEDYKAWAEDKDGHLEDRLKRVEARGISAYDINETVESLFRHNQAGEGGTTLDKEGILDKYCRI